MDVYAVDGAQLSSIKARVGGQRETERELPVGQIIRTPLKSLKPLFVE